MTTLNLSKGNGLLNLTKAAPNFKTIKGILNWDMHPTKAKSLTEGFDLDIFAFVLNDNEKITSGNDVVYFNNKYYNKDVIAIPVDNRDGEGDDDEYIDMKLNQLDKNIVDLYVIIHDGEQRGQNFGMMANSSFTLVDFENNKEIQRYNLNEYTSETAIHIGRFSKKNGEWNFDSFGVGAIADPNTIVAAYM